jgi:hypothetical protein
MVKFLVEHCRKVMNCATMLQNSKTYREVFLFEFIQPAAGLKQMKDYNLTLSAGDTMEK